MSSITQKNEVVKRKFYDYLANSKGFSKTTIECFEDAVYLWEDFTNKGDLAGFTKIKAENFKNWLKCKKKVHTEGNISISYCYDIIRHLKTFFEWLSRQSGYKSKINHVTSTTALSSFCGTG